MWLPGHGPRARVMLSCCVVSPSSSHILDTMYIPWVPPLLAARHVSFVGALVFDVGQALLTGPVFLGCHFLLPASGVSFFLPMFFFLFLLFLSLRLLTKQYNIGPLVDGMRLGVGTRFEMGHLGDTRTQSSWLWNCWTGMWDCATYCAFWAGKT